MKPLRIGIDAKWFFEGPVSNQIVVHSLVKHLISENPGHQLVIFLNARHRSRPFPYAAAHVSLQYVWAGNNLLSNALLLPWHGKKLNLDFILYQNFTGVFGPTQFTYIHDVIFLSHPQFFTLPERMYFRLMPVLSRFAHTIIAISHSEKKRMQAHGVGLGCPVKVIYHAASESFKPLSSISPLAVKETESAYNLPPRFLLFVGRLNMRKNIGNLLKALTLTKDQTIPLVLVGEKEWKADPALGSLETIGIDPARIQFLGKVGLERLTVLYARATIFCFPSFAEGFGLPVLEAMKAGTPVLTSKHSAMEEICGEAGMYVNPTDPQDIANGIDALWSDEETRLQLSFLGTMRAQNFNWAQSARQLYAIFEAHGKGSHVL